ncbi:hypothetical protein BDV19DRAFT_327805 [Aspergillus venezuelensis]
MAEAGDSARKAVNELGPAGATGGASMLLLAQLLLRSELSENASYHFQKRGGVLVLILHLVAVSSAVWSFKLILRARPDSVQRKRRSNQHAINPGSSILEYFSHSPTAGSYFS